MFSVQQLQMTLLFLRVLSLFFEYFLAHKVPVSVINWVKSIIFNYYVVRVLNC
jgi:hypothetical protein